MPGAWPGRDGLALSLCVPTDLPREKAISERMGKSKHGAPRDAPCTVSPDRSRDHDSSPPPGGVFPPVSASVIVVNDAVVAAPSTVPRLFAGERPPKVTVVVTWLL